MSLLEYIKQQQEQLIAKVNYLTSNLNKKQMPDPVQFSLGLMEEVEDFEDHLKDPANSHLKQSVVSFLSLL